MMVLQSTAGSEQIVPASEDTYQDRRNRLITSLNELKSRISHVEQRHPYLGNDLSSTCDRAILSLQDGPYLQDTAAATKTTIAQPPAHKINPLSWALDKTGSGIVNCLDKMGDGIIFLFANISKAFNQAHIIS